VARLPLLYQLAKTATPDLTAFEREVLGVYLAHAGLHDGRGAYPSAQTIADTLEHVALVGRRPNQKVVVSRKPDARAVRRARSRLVDLGHLEADGAWITPTIDGVARGDKATPSFTVRITPSDGALRPPGSLDENRATGSQPSSDGALRPSKAVPARKHSTNARNCTADDLEIESAERAENGYSITEENVRLIFDAWHHLLRYGRRVELTTHRRDAICHALREHRGTVEQIREAIVNVAGACPDRENQRCTDLPHILHRDRLGKAIADDIDPDDWTSSPFGDGAY
jgi:hypothetical protein